MRSIKLTNNDILTTLRSHLMFRGFPFCLTKKPVLSNEQEDAFESLHKTLRRYREDCISKQELLPDNARNACAIETRFSEDEYSVLIFIFRAISKEFPLGNDMALRMHMPSREGFDSLQQRLEQITEGI